MGDKVLLKQNKTTVKPPFDPEAYEVDEKHAEVEADEGEAYLRKQQTSTGG